MPIDLKLKDKVAIVTGGSLGLGAESARQMAAEGSKLVLVSRKQDPLEPICDELIKTHSADILPIVADLTDPAAPNAIAKQATERFGRIDILANCAGAAQGGIFWEISDKVWDDAFQLKFFATVRMMRAVIPAMREQKYGRIVTIVGDTGRQPNPRLLPGSASNAALLAVIKGLADEAGPDGISVNAVNPGPTKTGRITTLFNNLSRDTGKSIEDIEADFTKDSPFKTMGDPVEVARIVVFLCSDAASNITGTSILTDGGRSRTLA